MTQLHAAWGIVIGIFIPILVVTISKVWDPVAEYLGYPFDVRRRVEDLGDAVKRLLEMKLDLIRLDPHPLSDQRVGWLVRVEDLSGKWENIDSGHKKCGLNYFTWCYLGKEAGKELKKAEELAGQGKDLLQAAQAAPRPVPDVHPQDRLWGMDSYKEAVLHFINDEDYNSRLLGIWGMGGVGKSSLLHYSTTSEHGNHNFHPVLFVQAGRGCTVGKLQDTIAKKMALPLLPNESSQGAIIFNHLKDKSFLLLVDDLWDYVDLEAVGIPMSLGTVPAGSRRRRKVVLATRSSDVCGKMGCRQNTIRIGCLGKEDAWKLFAHKAGDEIVNEAGIHQHAKQIVEECCGLPMALCMMGEHMSAKRDEIEWRAAKDQLSKLHQNTVTHENLLKRLQESYDSLAADMKERFLLCSLWPENENISMKILIRWWTGLGLLDGFCNASDTGYSFINYLVHLSILEKSDTGPDSSDSHVKIHNMVRKMALWIVNEHGYKNKWLPNCSYRKALSKEKWRTVEKAWVLKKDTSIWRRWSSRVRFPELKMLVAQHVFSLELIHYFQKITFLDLEGIRRDLPYEICTLTELEHLNLSATTIDVLPTLLKTLSNLKYLYIRNNRCLQTIPEGIITALENLRGLDLFCTGSSFPNVLKELADSKSLDLHMLGFTVRTVAEIITLGQLNGVCTQALCVHQFEDDKNPSTINLQLLSGLDQLRELAITESSNGQKVLVAEGGPDDDQWLFPQLATFELNNLIKLEKVIWKNAGNDIRVVSIYKCHKLRDVTWVHHLQFLEQLTVAHCQGMERLIQTEESPQGVGMNQTRTISFPRLEKLKLEDLPKLSMICEQACEFKELYYICVTGCNEIKNIQNQMYKQRMVKIDCSKDWWDRTTLPGFKTCLVTTFCS